MAEGMKHYRIALVGNPNCGKTTIFNQLTGARQHVGNYPGVTVERKTGFCRVGDLNIEIIDLPGIYSLANSSPEERVAYQELVSGKIDLIVNVIDAGNAQRNLYLSTQIAELEIPLLLDFNMIDDAEAQGLEFDLAKLSAFFGAPIVCTSGVTGRGVEKLKAAMASSLTTTPRRLPVKPKYGPKIEQALAELASAVESCYPAEMRAIPPRGLALRLLENAPEVRDREEFRELYPLVEKWRELITTRNGWGSDALMADYRYGVIAGACREAITENDAGRYRLSDRIDQVVTNRFLGIPIFLLIMYVVFLFTFRVGDYPMHWLDGLFNALGNLISALWPSWGGDFLRRLLVDGVIGGVGGVLVFLPNIILLFMAIAFLEGTGYMARAAFVMDGFMHLFGLHGKSFIPMLLGFGCSVPAVMATRTIESERDRLTTIMVIPFMSCGARLPIFTLLIPVFFAPQLQPLMMFLLYVIGTVVALIAARILKSTLFGGGEEVFVMELPPYRLPTLQSILIQMWERTVMYLRKAGTLILGAAIIMFLLNSFPYSQELEREYRDTTSRVEADESLSAEARTAELSRLKRELASAQLEYSLSGRIGKALSYVLSPLGFDWRVSSALVGALAGKELFVTQLGVLYSIEDNAGGEEGSGLRELLRENYTPLQGFAIMLFCLLTIPCLATVAIVRKESGSWKWALLQIVIFSLTAYVVTLMFYQLGIHSGGSFVGL